MIGTSKPHLVITFFIKSPITAPVYGDGKLENEATQEQHVRFRVLRSRESLHLNV
jgi:hypothetical protein